MILDASRARVRLAQRRQRRDRIAGFPPGNIQLPCSWPSFRREARKASNSVVVRQLEAINLPQTSESAGAKARAVADDEELGR